jgi:arylsulfatase A-like enzyme
MSRDAIRFKNAISTSSHTKDSFPGIFSSTFPSAQGRHHVDSSNTTLAQVFSDAGYETAGFHSTPMMNAYGYGDGFEQFKDLVDHQTNRPLDGVIKRIPSPLLSPLHRILKRLGGAGGVDAVDSRATASEVTDAATEFLDRMQEPFFLFVHYMDVHSPYWPPEAYVEEYAGGISEQRVRELNKQLLENKDSIHGDPETLSPRDLEQARALYDASIRYADDCISELLKTVDDLGLSDETVTVITADHGEEFLDHGGFFHGQKLYEELLHVPLLIEGPEINNGTRSEQVSHLGLAPTLLDYLEVSVPESMIGEPYTALFNGSGDGNEFALAESTVKRLGQDVGRVIACRHKSGLKLIFNEGETEWAADEWELYDLREDPEEKHNVYHEANNQILSEMKEHISGIREGTVQDEEVEVAEQRLKDLGYID